MAKISPLRARKLLDQLEAAADQFDADREIENDAIEPALRYRKSQDRELAAFVCAVFAYGKINHIKKSLHRLLDPMGDSPAEFLVSSDSKKIRALVKGWTHRFNTDRDAGLLLWWLKQVYTKYESIEDFVFGELADVSSIPASEIIEAMIARLSRLPCGPFGPLPAPGESFWFLFPRPTKGSACKRLCLYLRWMVGDSSFDLGLWKRFKPSQLVIPVDVHVLRQSRRLGLTTRKQADWKTALEITESLKCLDPENPTRFDFAICHLGIRGAN